MQITLLCEALKQAVQQSIEDLISISFISTNYNTSEQNLDRLEPSFMYTQLFKEILLDIDYDYEDVKELANFWRGQCGNNVITKKTIMEFEHNYGSQKAIEWYTREVFLYGMVNRALRLLKADIISLMGFFIRDLHHQIEDLYKRKSIDNLKETFTVYRGQGLSHSNFKQMKKAKGGLMSFNSFLSTTYDYGFAYALAESNQNSLNTLGILFEITVDPSLPSVPFGAIKKESKFKSEEEILFSMNTVFRIGNIDEIGNKKCLYHVELKLTDDDDQELHNLTDHLRKETPGSHPLERLGRLFNKLGQFSKAEELYTKLLEKIHDDSKKALYYNQLGLVTYHQGKYVQSIEFFEKFREILQKLPSEDILLWGTYYNNIGMTYDARGEHSTALLLHQKALVIRKTHLPENHHDLDTSYNNIGLQYEKLKQYPDAISSFEKSLQIKQKTLPQDHPRFAQTYNNLAMVYMNMKDYSKALSYYKKALEIKQKSLPENHPSLGTAYNNIGLVYDKMGQYKEALYFYEKDLEISLKTPDRDNPDLGISYANIAGIYYRIKEHKKALSYYERAAKILSTSLPPDHDHLRIVQNCILKVMNESGT